MGLACISRIGFIRGTRGANIVLILLTVHEFMSQKAKPITDHMVAL